MASFGSYIITFLYLITLLNSIPSCHFCELLTCKLLYNFGAFRSLCCYVVFISITRKEKLNLIWLHVQSVCCAYYIDPFLRDVIWTYSHHFSPVLTFFVVELSVLFLRTQSALTIVLDHYRCHHKWLITIL